MWALDDLYMLLHQSAMGAEHALADEGIVCQRLEEELAMMGGGPPEPLVDSISPDGRIMRAHLRPLLQHGIGQAGLLQAFIQTSKQVKPCRERFIECAALAASLCVESILPFDREETAKYLHRMMEAGLPAVHHSARFEELYRPAYRVVAREFLPEEILAAA
jgi:hypothetical protein